MGSEPLPTNAILLPSPHPQRPHLPGDEAEVAVVERVGAEGVPGMGGRADLTGHMLFMEAEEPGVVVPDRREDIADRRRLEKGLGEAIGDLEVGDVVQLLEQRKEAFVGERFEIRRRKAADLPREMHDVPPDALETPPAVEAAPRELLLDIVAVVCIVHGFLALPGDR